MLPLIMRRQPFPDSRAVHAAFQKFAAFLLIHRKTLETGR